MKNLIQFTEIYPVDRTLRFELKPELLEGQTIDDFWSNYLDENKKDSFYNKDKKRNDDYPIVKLILDQFHKNFISLALSSFLPESAPKCPTWNDLFDAYCKDRKSKDFANLQDKMRESISNHFKKHEWWQYISSYSKLIGSLLKQLVENDDDFVESIQERDTSLTREKMLEALETFNRFSVYFGNYADNRSNMYKKEAQGTSIANRIVNENLPKFFDNISVYRKLKATCPNELESIQDNLKDTLKGISLDEIFTPCYFNECLTQDGIEKYNWILGGNPNEDVLGINSVGNEYLQHHPESKLKLKDLVMTQLYKQILSDRVQPSFLPQQYKSEEDLMDSVFSFLSAVEKQGLLESVKRIMETLYDNDTDLSKVYVLGSNLTKLSHLLYGDWNLLGEKLREKLVTSNTKKAQQERDKEIEKWLDNKCFSLLQIKEIEEELLEQTQHPLSTEELFTTLNIWKKENETSLWQKVSLIEQCKTAYIVQFATLRKSFKDGKSISTDESKQILKEVLDKYMELYHIVELLRLGNKSAYLEKDSFYVDYERLFESSDEDTLSLSYIIPLYNKVRSFLTRKLSNEGKMLLKFDSPTLADGWDANKEDANNATILRHSDKYYLMLINPLNKPRLEDGICENGSYRKIVYHQIADASKDLPNLMMIDGKTVRKTGRKSQDGFNHILEDLKNKYLPDEINRIRKCGSYLKTSDSFNKEDSQAYLKYYMKRLLDYKKDEMVFHFKEPNEYESYADFLNDVAMQKYSISFVSFSKDKIEEWRKENKVMLFQISNKDFKEGSCGTENIHTLYWKELFSSRNMDNTIFKLNGGAELFYRCKLSSKPFMHKKGSILVNKTLSDGTPICDEMYKHFVTHFNGKGIVLTDEEVRLLPQVKTNRAKLDIIKDKRYYEHKFFMHVPITINFKAPKITQQQFNERTLELLRQNKKQLNIIGIDRGERNLIYVSVINQRGENIIPPKHFNLIETKTYEEMTRKYNYLEKLKQTEQNRDEARKNWTTIERIKDLKSGYLSQVVHEIAKMVVKYNAIVVLEDLNFGFKRGRFNVERQVYQNFEKMLIQKLNYLAFKKDAPSPDYGNVWNGLQLTAPFTSFKDLGKQSGWLFYVPAGYTSKIDPATGFVNLFNMNKPAIDYKTFFGSFTEICYKDDMFYFTFDYSNEKFNTVRTDYTNVWTLSTHGERIVREKDELREIQLTQKFKKFFSDDGVNIPLSEVSVERIKLLEEVKLKELFGLFKLLLKMRNTNGQEDYIISPVAGENPFKTGANNYMGLTDADANGAYNIALKGLYWVHNGFPVEDKYLKYIKDTDWFKFIQTKPYLNE